VFAVELHDGLMSRVCEFSLNFCV